MYYCSLVWPLGKTGSFYHFWDIMWFPFIVIHLEVFVTFLPPPHYSVCIELKASQIRSSSEWHFVFLLKHIITSGLLKFPMPWWGRRLALCFWDHLFQHGIVLPASCWTHLEADSALKEALAFAGMPRKATLYLRLLEYPYVCASVSSSHPTYLSTRRGHRKWISS